MMVWRSLHSEYCSPRDVVPRQKTDCILSTSLTILTTEIVSDDRAVPDSNLACCAESFQTVCER